MSNNNVLFDYGSLSKDIKNKLNYGDTLRPAAAEIGIGLSTLHRIVNWDGKSTMKVENVIKICNWLGKPVNDYINETQSD